MRDHRGARYRRAVGRVLVGVVATAGATVFSGAAPEAGASVSWSAISAPLPANAVAGSGMTLVSSSCPVDGWCVAVGNYPALTGTTYYTAGLLLTESGGSWTAAQAPLPANAMAGDPQAFVESVSCTGVGSCVAVGRYLDGSNATQGLVEQLAAGSWSAAEAPLPGDATTSGTTADAELVSVACASAGACTAAGRYSGTGGDQALLETLASGTWTPAAAPDPAAASGSQLLSLSCPDASDCVAAGTYEVAGIYYGLVDVEASGSWTGATLPLPAGSSAAASVANGDVAVSCGAAGSCAVAGTTFDGNYEGFLDVLAAGAWSSTPAPTPGGVASPDVQLSSVSCPAIGTCVATGLYTQSGVSLGLVESLAGGAWSASGVPVPSTTPAGAGVDVLEVTCPAAGSCVAEGQVNSNGTTTGLFWYLSGGTWGVTGAPLPSDAASNPDPTFAPIVCPASGVCVAVGTYLGANGREGVVDTDPSLAASSVALTMAPAPTTTSTQQAMTYTATVSGSMGTPTGIVTVSSGSTYLCTAVLSGGTGSCTAGMPTGNTVLASYSGDGTYAGAWGTAAVLGTPAHIADVGSWWQCTRINTFFANRLQAVVTDSNGNPVAGVTVVWHLPTSGASAYFWGPSSAVTDANGVATPGALLANSIVGTYWVTATVNGAPSLSAGWYLGNTKK